MTKLVDYLLEILSETGKKDEILSNRPLMKAQENLTDIMGPFSCHWAHLGTSKKIMSVSLILHSLI